MKWIVAVLALLLVGIVCFGFFGSLFRSAPKRKTWKHSADVNPVGGPESFAPVEMPGRSGADDSGFHSGDAH